MIVILLCGLLIGSPGNFAQEIQQTVKDSLKQYWGEKLGEEIQALAVSETEEEESYAKVLVTKTKIKFMDEEGKLKLEYKRCQETDTYQGKKWIVKDRAIDEVRISKDGKFLGIHTPLLAGYDCWMKSRYSVMGSDGELQWENEIEGYCVGEIWLSPVGDYAIAQPYGLLEDEPVLFLSPEGFEKVDFPAEYGEVRVSFSENGEFWTIAGNIGVRERKDTTQVMLFNKNREKLWKEYLKVKGGMVRIKLFGNIDSISVVTGGFGTPPYFIYVFDRNMKLLRESPYAPQWWLKDHPEWKEERREK